MDNDSLPTFSVPYTNITSFESGHAGIYVQLSSPSESAVSFTYSTTPGTATTDDFTEQNSVSHTFSSSLTDTILIPITADEIDEIDETFSVNFANITGATFDNAGAPTVTVTIQDDDLSLISISDSSVTEADSQTVNMVFTINLDKVSSRNISVTWIASTESSNHATRGTDYAVTTNSHTGVAEISAGSSSTTISIPIAGDTIEEPNETFTVTLSNATGGAEISDEIATGTINDNDRTHYEPILTTTESISVNESEGMVVIPLNLSYATDDQVSVYYSTSSDSAERGSDFANNSSFRTYFSTYTSTSSILIPIINDEIYEGPEIFTVSLSNLYNADFSCREFDSSGNYCYDRYHSITVTITIIDDETEPEISFADLTPSVNESDSGLSLIVNLSHESALDGSVEYSTSDETAIGGIGGASDIDYESQSMQTLNLNAGQISTEFTVPISDDSLNEGNETFIVTLSNAINVKFANGASSIELLVTIIDDETPTLSVVDSTLSVRENAGTTAIELKLSGPASGDVVVTYSTSITSASDAAQQADFTEHSSQMVTISSPATTGLIEIPITNDEFTDANEIFTLTLSGVTGAVFEGGTNIVKTVTIIDDEGLPTLTFDTTPVEITEGSGSAMIGLSLSSALSGDESVTITYSTEAVTASNDGSDYTAQTNATHLITATDPATRTISIPIVDDQGYEGNETFNVKITDVTGAVFADDTKEISKTITIMDNEPVSLLSVQSTSITASESGNAEIMIQLTNPSDSDVTFTYSTTADSAMSDDYEVQSSTQFTFGTGTTDTIIIPITNDEIDEENEQFTVTFANLKGASFGDSGSPTVTVTIEDDDQAQFYFEDSSSFWAESNPHVEFTVRLDRESTRKTSVTWTASTEIGDTAVLGEDYAGAPNSHTGTVEILAGSTSTTIRVPIENDSKREESESFTLTLSNPTGGATILDGTAKGYISNDGDYAYLNAPLNIIESEANGYVEIPLTLTTTTYEPVPLYYTTTANTATGGGVDYETRIYHRHTIPAETLTSSIMIPVTSDGIYEGSETFSVRLFDISNSRFDGYRVRELNIIITIVDNETMPEISFEDIFPRINEYEETATIRVILSHASIYPTSVLFSTANLSAIGGASSDSGIDFIAQTNQLVSFPAGETYADITIPIIQDNLNEGDEILDMVLRDASGGVFANNKSSLRHKLTIIDDESPTLSVVSSSLNVGENVGTAIIELKLSAPTSNNVEVTYSTSTESPASAGTTDFTVQSSAKIAIVSPGTIGRIAIPIINDELSEGSETFTLTLSGITGAVFSGGASIVETVTIFDDDQVPTLTVDSASIDVTEGSTSASIGLTLSPSPTTAVSVKYSTIGGTASNDGLDFTIHSDSTYSFASNTATGTISIPIEDDGVLEGNEKFFVTLNSVSGATFGPGINKIYITVNIMDNTTTQPTFSVLSTRISTIESGSVEIPIRLSQSSSNPVTFTYSTASGTASNSDFSEQNSVTHTFGSGLMDSIMIQIQEDSIDELDETFTVTFANLSGATFGRDGTPTVTVTILDDDQSLIGIWDRDVYEPGTGTTNIEFYVFLDNESTRDISFTWTASTEDGDQAIKGIDYAVTTNSYTGIAEIPAGSTSTTFRIPIAGNGIYEPNLSKFFTVTLSNPTGGAEFANETARGRIREGDGRPYMYVPSSVKVREVGGNAVIPIRLSHLTSERASIYYYTSDNTASSGSDYSYRSQRHYMNTLTLNSSIMIPITDDDILEGNETFRVELYSADDAQFCDPDYFESNNACTTTYSAYITVTIIDDEEEPVFSVAEETIIVNESDGNAVINTLLTEDYSNEVSVMYTTSDGTAIGGSDFTSQDDETHTITGTSGMISIPITDDSNRESDETFEVTLSNPTNANLGNGIEEIVVTIVIVDDDGHPRLSFVDDSVDVLESAGNVTLTFELSEIPSSQVRVDYGTHSSVALAGTDYTSVNTFTNITSKTASITIPILDDSVKDGNKSLKVRVLTQPSNAVFEFGKTRLIATVTIWDDESFPSFSLFAVGGQPDRSICGDRPANETANLEAHGELIANSDLGAKGCQTEGTDVQFRVLASSPPVDDIPLNLTISQEGDFVFSPIGSSNSLALGQNTVIFRKGQLAETYIVQTDKNLYSDGANGYDRLGIPSADGSITATLDSGSYYDVSNTASSAEVTIWDTDRPRVSIEPVSVSGVDEGDPAVFKVTAHPLTTSSLTVLVDISQAGYEGVDFLADTAGQRSVTLTPKAVIENGITRVSEVSGLLSEPTAADATDELNGLIVAKIKDSSDYNINPLPNLATATVTVRDDDDPTGEFTGPIVILEPASSNPVIEGGSAGFLLRAQVTDQPRTINIGLSSTGGDFIDKSASNIIHTTELTTYDENGNSVVTQVSALSTQVVLPANQGSVYFYIQSMEDSVDEPDGDIVATIMTGSGYYIGYTNVAVVRILDDDSVPEISITRIGVEEVAEGATIQFNVSSNRMTHENKTIYLDVSDGKGDFLDSRTQSGVVIPAGSQSAPFYVYTLGDNVPEPHGEIQVTIQDDNVFPVNYTVSSSNHVAMVSINDNQGGAPTPEISISGAESAIVEGDVAKIYLDASSIIYETLEVGITVSQGSSDFLAITDLSKIVFLPNEDEYILELATVDDSNTESNGTVTISIQNGTGYTVHGTNNSVSVSVVDNDGANSIPKISVAANSVNSITEGTSANFTITSDSYNNINQWVSSEIIGK